jgi:hypothetical protein
MLVSPDQPRLIGSIPPERAFGHRRPALQFLKELAAWGVFVEAA